VGETEMQTSREGKKIIKRFWDENDIQKRVQLVILFSCQKNFKHDDHHPDKLSDPEFISECLSCIRDEYASSIS
jgi:hypothetical protein